MSQIDSLTHVRLLIVEDEFFVADSMKWVLNTHGLERIQIAKTIDTAVELLASQAFDVAVLDLNVRGQRVDPVADRLNQLGVPFAILSGYATTDEPVFLSVPHMTKPVSPDHLVEVIRQLVDGRQKDAGS